MESANFNLQISWRLKCQCKETSGMERYACDSNTREPMAEGLTWVWSQPELHREHPTNYNYRVRPCLKKRRENGEGPHPQNSIVTPRDDGRAGREGWIIQPPHHLWECRPVSRLGRNCIISILLGLFYGFLQARATPIYLSRSYSVGCY